MEITKEEEYFYDYFNFIFFAVFSDNGFFDGIICTTRQEGFENKRKHG